MGTGKQIRLGNSAQISILRCRIVFSGDRFVRFDTGISPNDQTFHPLAQEDLEAEEAGACTLLAVSQAL